MITQPIVLPSPLHELFGTIAVKLGFISSDQLDEVLAVQEREIQKGQSRRIGELLAARGWLSPRAVDRVLLCQKALSGEQSIGPFRILSRLGQGAMGTVYRARQNGLDRDIALKILSPVLARQAEFRELFFREAQIVARLQHPHIVAGIDVGQAGDLFYLAMEFVDGPSVCELMGRARSCLGEETALCLARQAASALDHAHSHFILHRDIKPENILVDPQGQAKLTDLGLALVFDRCRAELFPKMAIGTPHYISPEQAVGETHLTAATDLYSLGVTLFHMLTGAPPYDSPDRQALLMKHLAAPIPDPREFNPRLSDEAAEVCIRLMQKDPVDRFPSAHALAYRLGQILEERGKQTASSTGQAISFGSRRAVNRRRKSSGRWLRLSWRRISRKRRS